VWGVLVCILLLIFPYKVAALNFVEQLVNNYGMSRNEIEIVENIPVICSYYPVSDGPYGLYLAYQNGLIWDTKYLESGDVSYSFDIISNGPTIMIVYPNANSIIKYNMNIFTHEELYETIINDDVYKWPNVLNDSMVVYIKYGEYNIFLSTRSNNVWAQRILAQTDYQLSKIRAELVGNSLYIIAKMWDETNNDILHIFEFDTDNYDLLNSYEITRGNILPGFNTVSVGDSVLLTYTKNIPNTCYNYVYLVTIHHGSFYETLIANGEYFGFNTSVVSLNGKIYVSHFKDDACYEDPTFIVTYKEDGAWVNEPVFTDDLNSFGLLVSDINTDGQRLVLSLTTRPGGIYYLRQIISSPPASVSIHSINHNDNVEYEFYNVLGRKVNPNKRTARTIFFRKIKVK
jgi:hypothetical protein